MSRASEAKDLSGFIEAVLTAIYDYSEAHPGLLSTAMTDEAVISAGSAAVGATALVARMVGAGRWRRANSILGQAIVGAIHQASSSTYGSGRGRANLLKTLTQFIVRALAPRS